MSDTEPQAVLFLCTGNYYRSRYAELYWNHHWAAATGRRAISAGFRPLASNPGPIALPVVERCGASGIPLLEPRMPLKAAEEHLADAWLIIALDETEHRPYVAELFPAFADRIVYWQVPDAGDMPIPAALAAIERAADALAETMRR